MKEIVVLSSSGGGLLRYLLQNLGAGCRINKVVVDRECGAVMVARENGVEVGFWDREKDPEGITLLEEIGDPFLIVSAGFLVKVPTRVIASHTKSIINSHPSLLPEFGGAGMYGLRVHREVIRSGSTVSGCTIHYMNEEIDQGEIILQKSTAVLEADDEMSLGSRIHLLEKESLLAAICNLVLNEDSANRGIETAET